jgi:superfamily II RNA helicase
MAAATATEATSPYLKIKLPSEPCDEVPTAIQYKYELDNFQKHAVAAIHRDENVLVTAKTGSGKTMVGEYQIAHSLARGGRVFYTTPIKSLSNQKFNDLKAMFPSVGIMTGDIKFQPQAQVVVLTTEILRNLLYKHGTVTESIGLSGAMSLDGLDAVIFDEVHYINNPDRGKVWEETMILLPPHVKMILLSATIDQPELFASWLGDIRARPIVLIPTKHRVVPLTHAVLGGGGPGQEELLTIMDEKENFNAQTYKEWLQGRKRAADAAKEHKARVARRDWTDETDVTIARGINERTRAFTATLNDCVKFLAAREALPALFFCFSRRGCEEHAARISTTLLTTCEITDVKHIMKFHLRDHMADLQTLPQFHTIRALAERGIGFHHSGLLPVLKEMLEILFSRGLVRALFCTETFAVGINMPTKTAVFLGVKKYDEGLDAQRVITTDEYIQMAGRAGRRGLDKFGLVLYLPEDDPVSVEDLKRMMKSGMPAITSRMDFGYDFILKSLHAAQGREGRDILEKSYWYRQAAERRRALLDDVASLREKQAAVPIAAQDLAEFAALGKLQAAFKVSRSKEDSRAVNHWRDRHVGPKWVAAERLYKQYLDYEEDIATAERSLAAVERAMTGEELLGASIQFLTEAGYINSERGIIATEFNEAHPIMATELYMSGVLDGVSQDDLCIILAAFLEKERGDRWRFRAPPGLSDRATAALERIGVIATEMRELEEGVRGARANPEFWDLSSVWPTLIAQYLTYLDEGVDVTSAITLICTDNGIYEGNFIRAVLKISNMLEELQGVATYGKNIEMLGCLEGVGRRLVAGLIVPSSLYLTLA